VLRKAKDVVEFLLSSFRRYRDEDRVLIYQMGKVGSTSLARALGDRAIQIHNFFPRNEPCPRKPWYRARWYRRPIHWLFYLAIRRGVRRRRQTRIITLVRDPIGRNVSMFFHDLHFWLAYYFSEVKPNGPGREGVDTLIDCFTESFDHRYPLEWFDRELKRLTGVDVYAHSFDRAAGWTRIDEDGVSLLIVQTERLEDCWQVIEDFCGRKLEWREDNRGERKWYGGLYTEFLDRYCVSPDELDEIYASRYATFFFSDEARATFRRRWQRKPPGSAALPRRGQSIGS
jgi:hypothetical protein